MKEKIIYTKRIALELRRRGFTLLYTGINENFPQYNTYVFEETPELLRVLSELTRK